MKIKPLRSWFECPLCRKSLYSEQTDSVKIPDKWQEKAFKKFYVWPTTEIQLSGETVQRATRVQESEVNFIELTVFKRVTDN